MGKIAAWTALALALLLTFFLLADFNAMIEKNLVGWLFVIGYLLLVVLCVGLCYRIMRQRC